MFPYRVADADPGGATVRPLNRSAKGDRDRPRTLVGTSGAQPSCRAKRPPPDDARGRRGGRLGFGAVAWHALGSLEDAAIDRPYIGDAAMQ
jgi:hypothetical protein